MATRNTNTANNTAEVTPETPAEEPAPIIAETQYEVPVSHFVEIPMFVEDWVKTQSGIPHEALGTFQFVAKQNGWLADTPSGWEAKFARWAR